MSIHLLLFYAPLLTFAVITAQISDETDEIRARIAEVADGRSLTIDCKGQYLSINTAQYMQSYGKYSGRGCTLPESFCQGINVYELVGSYCRNQTSPYSCEVSASAADFGAPCGSSVPMRLVISYQCTSEPMLTGIMPSVACGALRFSRYCA